MKPHAPRAHIANGFYSSDRRWGARFPLRRINAVHEGYTKQGMLTASASETAGDLIDDLARFDVNTKMGTTAPDGGQPFGCNLHPVLGGLLLGGYVVEVHGLDDVLVGLDRGCLVGGVHRLLRSIVLHAPHVPQNALGG